MPKSPDTFDVYLEIGQKKIFASAIDWPGWSRAGRDEASALQALFDYAPRYARVMQQGGVNFKPPTDISQLVVVDRVQGSADTDFGVPAHASAYDDRPVDAAELKRFQAVLKACWLALDTAAKQAKGKELRKGPRGGGRELDGIIEHVNGGGDGYTSRLAYKVDKSGEPDLLEMQSRTRQAMLDALTIAVENGIPEVGPRGGKRWTPRYFVRRAAWHELDHVWEIEDRIIP